MIGTKSKKPGIFGKLYLALYNFIQTLGWSYILYQVIQYYINPLNNTLWNKAELSVVVFQNAAVLEVIHTTIGLVPSNVIITTFQVLSRVMVVVGVILATPYTYAAASPGLPLLLIAWSITEVIRYFYYFLNLFAIVPHIMIWLRYTTFIILYPIGVTGELLCFYAAVRYASTYPHAWSYVLPNTWNFTFSYLYVLIGIMLLYIPLFPKLYMHMFAQRRKMLNSNAAVKKTD
ncbi:very-long-chain (3R)-3-hydroxyacyl-CoA dehydratase 2 [Odontomachus brunneus]|uniref:very-long-chain (3R)-3-hydroxyacyl-CoA dehydratase 2 n=1 Tax=Odontomachus brunneus TaxID=486640 RepID=UPI0013F1BB5F|nr:very-long-chain (3R)-3-hydroxyacyl-CoA dehydratase 2 [Odontomachus brunneus]